MSKLALLLLLASSSLIRVRAHALPTSADDHSGPGSLSTDFDQTPSDSSVAITGMVLDPSGAAIAGAQVTLKIADGASIQSTTNTVGVFNFEKVAPGTYSLSVQATGFEGKKQIVAVGKKQSAPLRISLQIASQNQLVTVNGQDLSVQVTTDVTKNQNANTIDRDALDRVPVFDHDYITTLSRFLDDSAIGTNGVTLVVNGLEANGPGVTPSAIQEVKINQNPYSAEYARPGKGRIEVITKPGTREFHGDLNFLFRDSVFDARNAFAASRPSEQRRIFEGNITGPAL